MFENDNVNSYYNKYTVYDISINELFEYKK